MQKKTDKLAEASQRIGLNISKTNTQVMRLNCKNTEPIKFQNGDTIKETKDFTYLRAVVSTEAVAIKIWIVDWVRPKQHSGS